MENQEEPKEEQDRNEGSFQEKVKDTMNTIRKNERVDQMMDFVGNNTRDSIAYGLLFLGLVLLIFKPLVGGLLVGMVGGIYFADEIFSFVKNFNDFIEEQGLVRTLILGGVILGLFIEAPMILIGITLAVAIKRMVLAG